jgi:hypothetical protein
LRHQFAPLIGAERQRLGHRIGEGLLEVLQQLLFSAAGQFIDIDIELGRDPVQQRPADVAFVVFNEVQIAGRNADQPRQGDLGNLERFPPVADAKANRRTHAPSPPLSAVCQ